MNLLCFITGWYFPPADSTISECLFNNDTHYLNYIKYYSKKTPPKIKKKVHFCGTSLYKLKIRFFTYIILCKKFFDACEKEALNYSFKRKKRLRGIRSNEIDKMASIFSSLLDTSELVCYNVFIKHSGGSECRL